MLLQLEHDGAIDIAPGQRDSAVSDHLLLPIDVTCSQFTLTRITSANGRVLGGPSGWAAPVADPDS